MTISEQDDKFREECGLMAVWGHDEPSNLVYLGLYAQQHRGQEGAGIVSYDSSGDSHFSVHKGIGLVSDVFNNFDFSKLPGRQAIGHVRYTIAGGHLLSNVQPFCSEISLGKVALAHNGNLVNADTLRNQLISEGSIFSSTSDTEAILHLLAKSSRNVLKSEAVIAALERLEGAYSLLIMFEDRLFAIRDPKGFRPLCIGRLDGAYVVASETCAFDLIGATYERDVNPGEIVEIMADNTLKSYYPFGVVAESKCIFEYVYFARPDSLIYGRPVYSVRKRMGMELSKEKPVEADYVIAVPDSGVPAALGYSEASKIPFEHGLIRNHYVGRTFIEPSQAIRDFGVKIKLNPNREVLQGKRIIVVDDSIVRGTTSRKLIKMLREAGAKEIHMRISAPPITDPCYYGIDTPDKELLIAATKSLSEIEAYLEVDSLAYLSLDGLYRAVKEDRGKFCDACFTGLYPIGKGADREQQQQKLF